MEHAMLHTLSYANLFDPAQASAAAARAALWNLPRRVCHPLDHYQGRCVSAAVAAYDADIERSPVAADEEREVVPQTAARSVADSDDDL